MKTWKVRVTDSTRLIPVNADFGAVGLHGELKFWNVESDPPGDPNGWPQHEIVHTFARGYWLEVFPFGEVS